MKIMEVIKLIKEVFSRIPENTKDNLFANSGLTNRTIVKQLTLKFHVWGRKHYLAKHKFYSFLRAVAQAAILYYMAIGIFYAASSISVYSIRLLLGAIVLSADVTFLHYFLWRFHRLAFIDVLFEQSLSIQKKEYRWVGFITKIICELQSILLLLRYTDYMEKSQIISSWIASLEGWTLIFLFICYGVYACRYLATIKTRFKVSAKDIPDGKIQIHEISTCHEINLYTQTVIELHSGDLYIARYTQKHNPNFENTPEPYTISAKAVSYVQFGHFKIKYDRETKNGWSAK